MSSVVPLMRAMRSIWDEQSAGLVQKSMNALIIFDTVPSKDVPLGMKVSKPFAVNVDCLVKNSDFQTLTSWIRNEYKKSGFDIEDLGNGRSILSRYFNGLNAAFGSKRFCLSYVARVIMYEPPAEFDGMAEDWIALLNTSPSLAAPYAFFVQAQILCNRTRWFLKYRRAYELKGNQHVFGPTIRTELNAPPAMLAHMQDCIDLDSEVCQSEWMILPKEMQDSLRVASDKLSFNLRQVSVSKQKPEFEQVQESRMPFLHLIS